MVKEDGSPKFKDYADYIQNHIRRPGVGPLIGWRGADGTQEGRGEANPDQIAALYRKRRLLSGPCPARSAVLQTVERRLSGLGGGDLVLRGAAALPVLASGPNRCASFRLAAEGHGADPAARSSARPAETGDGPAAAVVSALWRYRSDGLGLSPPRADPAPDGHVSFLGQPERLAAPDPGHAISCICRRRSGPNTAFRTAIMPA